MWSSEVQLIDGCHAWNPIVEHTFRVKMLNVQFSGMRKSFGLSHWNFTPSSHCIIWPLENKATR